MKYKQLNKSNDGIYVGGDVPRGYRHEDGLHFDTNHPIHQLFMKLSKDILIAYPDAKKILDIGSGAGNLRYCLKELNPDLLVVTIDGNRESINGPFIDKDRHITARTDVDYTIVDENNEVAKFDLITCYEHFEHIEDQYFDIFLKNMKKHASKDAVLLASVADYSIPVHPNIKSYSEWDRLLSQDYGMTKINQNLLTRENYELRFRETYELHYKINP